MAQQIIQPGSSANDGTGDTLRTGAAKINANFTELYGSVSYSLPTASNTVLGGVKVDGTTIIINGSTISSRVPTASTTVLGGVKVDGTTIVANDGVISSQLPTASTTVLGGVKVDGTSITIANGVISSGAAYTLPTASDSVLGGVKVDGTTITINNGVISYTLPTASNSVLGAVKVDNSSITISNGVISSNIPSRTTVSGTSASLAPAASGNVDIVGFKSYALFKIQVSGAAWVTLYTDNASRSADASRLETVDPLPGSGVIAEIITTGSDTVLISPSVFGFNNENVPTTSIPIKVVNKGGTSATITVTLTLLKLES